ncbi:phasin family protein [Natranaerobius trueperi]|uniref:Polyhydroxyalkanoate synthesis regulator n=1 Tax=Natranaerobius trueperi TaxID=759412 RepID=A0A226BWV4_9FIRM|nr:polyhydroxyalkanoate synthesis regulator [Natranaerobius trueperi]OWZ82794.1 polyhydroxyalkanoate synthesis regulator [Natranaerobius trueperi]
MKNLVKKSFAFGLGLAITSKEQIETMVDDLVKKGEVAPEESKRVIDQMLERGEDERERLMHMIKEQVQQNLRELDTASRDEVEEIKSRLSLLEKKVDKIEYQRNKDDSEE